MLSVVLVVVRIMNQRISDSDARTSLLIAESEARTTRLIAESEARTTRLITESEARLVQRIDALGQDIVSLRQYIAPS